MSLFNLSLPAQLRKAFLSYRVLSACVLLGGSLLLVVGISLSTGAISLSWWQLWQALLHQGEPINQTILWDLRLPRTIAALIVGAALGMSGALLQGMLRNGLADPFLLGISAGAGLVAVGLVTLGLFQAWLPIAAWVGAILTTLFVYVLARTSTGVSVERLILGGVAVSSLFGAIQSTMLLFADDGKVQAALNWLIGSLNGRGWLEVRVAGPYILVALLCGCFLARSVNILNLGDDLAVGLGFSLMRSRLFIGAVATLLAAGAVSVGGLIGFVGLVVPHGVRLLVGTDYRWVLPFSAIGGALVLTFADMLSRLGAVELPVGAVTALLGSPLFVWLLSRRSAATTSL
ncbi:MAG TPA: iron ABC transporter permease [Chroococcales cyanobacterium]